MIASELSIALAPANLGPEGWDSPGALTIVVQGSLFATNLAETATYCNHWRAICPHAQIVLSISVTDILHGSAGRDIELEDARLVTRHADDGAMQAALARLKAACDVILLSRGATPMPEFKFGERPNNLNFQITAAKTGLARATGVYTLRIRSDIVFHDRSFLSFYGEQKDVRRRPMQVFHDRVMISPYFTLNPFTLERLPYHFSDWFHLGRTEDVRAIWDMGELSLADAVHHQFHPHHPDANELERRFQHRLATEQHVSVSLLKRRLSDFRLDHMTDAAAAQRSVEILLSDFLVYDPDQVPTLFTKYAKTFRDPNQELLCITHRQWRALLEMPEGTDYRTVYAGAARRARIRIAIRKKPALRGLKVLLGAARYVGRRLGLTKPGRRKPAFPGA